ncbi:putative mitochondrial membrane protein FMP10, partial [Cytospora mali]
LHQSPPHTSAAAAATTPGPPPGPSPPPRRRRPRWISAIFLLLLGATTGTAIRAVLAPPPPLLPGTEVDAALAADIRAAASHLPIVKQLLSDPDWSSNHHEAYEGLALASRPRRITTGALGGSRGVGGYQHVWRNGKTGEVVAVVYFGTGTIGWPGVVHGGVIATILDEHSARAAVRDLSASGKGPLTAKLDITYKNPTLSSDFYVVRANAVPEEALAPEEKGKRGRKVWVDARIETVEGRVCVESRALFVAPKGVELRAVPENF